MRTKIQVKSYGPDCTEEEKQAIKDRAYIVKDNILLYEELPIYSEYSFKLFGEKFDELTENFDEFYLLIDLRDVVPPNAHMRNFIKEFFQSFSKLNHIAAFTEKNFIANIAAQFILGKLKNKTYSVHKSYAGALKAIENSKNK